MKEATVADVVGVLESAAPAPLAMPGDNVGLLVGDPAAEVTAVPAALDATEAVLDEALALGAELIVAHHPLIYEPLQRVTEAETTGRIVRRPVRSGTACAAAHTNLDAARGGTADALVARPGIPAPRPMPAPTASSSARWTTTPRWRRSRQASSSSPPDTSPPSGWCSPASPLPSARHCPQ